MLVALAAAIAGALAANLLIAERDLLPFLAICIAPFLMALATWRLLSARSSARVTPSERQTRYAFDTLHAPYWQALVMHGMPAAMPPLIILSLSNLESADHLALLLITILPIAYLCAALVLHFEKQRAQRLLSKAGNA